MRLTSLTHTLVLLLCAAAMSACAGGKLPDPAPWDADGDSFPAEWDCDDADGDVFPGAVEVCEDRLDNDCDGGVDGDDADCSVGAIGSADVDADADGYRLPEDCDDRDAAVYPGAPERCGTDQDDDCGGTLESDVVGVDAVGCVEWYPDLDADGFGAAESGGESVCTCGAPEATEAVSAWADNLEDCDDTAPEVNPDATPSCATEAWPDVDCDDADDPSPPTDCLWWYQDDADGDGVGDGLGDPAEAVCACEAPTGYVDNDDGCDEGDMDTYYRDADGDGYGALDEPDDGSPRYRVLCTAEGAYSVRSASDCDDDDPGVYPGAEDDCGGVDRDCDNGSAAAELDEQDAVGALNCTDFYLDADGDFFGAEGSSPFCLCSSWDGETLVPITDLSRYESYTATVDTDCDDSSEAINPEADEICDEIDDDCDGMIDDGAIDAGIYYFDGDGDGQGGASYTSETLCAWYAEENSYVLENHTDCDDDDDTVMYRPEDDTLNQDMSLCDGADNDCDGDTDEGLTSTYYIDSDRDGFGKIDGRSAERCDDDHLGWAETATDCDDVDPNVHPGRAEICNDKDDDCDNIYVSDEYETYIDEGLTNYYYRDKDGDGLGDDSTGDYRCDADADGYSTIGGDCDDTKRSVLEAQPYFPDEDGDAEGASDAAGAEMCPSELVGEYAGWVSNSDDCDDEDPAVNTSGVEECDNKDNDCDGRTDEGLGGIKKYSADSDGDGHGDPEVIGVDCLGDGPDDTFDSGWVTGSGDDCDDGDAAVNPDAEEICDAQDNDCDGQVDDEGYTSDSPMPGCCTLFTDMDLDGFGADDSLSQGCACLPGVAQSFSPTDCSAVGSGHPLSTVSDPYAATDDCGYSDPDTFYYADPDVLGTSDLIPIEEADPFGKTSAGEESSQECWLLPGKPYSEIAP